MNIGMILESNFPPDIRVSKEARSLINRRHKVYLLCYTDRKEEAGKFLIEDINIIRFYSNRFISRIHKLFFSFFFFNYRWFKEIDHLVNKYSIEVLHVHDLPLVKTALSVSKRKKIPVIADLHENYPAAIEQYMGNKNILTIIRKITFDRYRRWKLYEKVILQLVDHIITVVPEASQRLRDYGVPEEKIHIVSNTVDLENIKNFTIDTELAKRFKDKYTILYTGYLNYHRGIDTLILSLKYLKDKIPNIRLVIVGIGHKSYHEELNKLIHENDFKEYIIFEGWQPFRKIFSYISSCSACIVPHKKSEHTDTTIPHKLFQYMAKKKPVIVSNCNPLKRIIEETESGLVYESENPESLSMAIFQLFEEKELTMQMAEKGYKVVHEKYNWAEASKNLIDMYSNCLSLPEKQ